MNIESEVVQLGDGGRLAYSEYGAADGVPVLFCHGWPSSRTMAQLTETAARKLGVRIISPDRPGERCVRSWRISIWNGCGSSRFRAALPTRMRLRGRCRNRWMRWRS